MPPWSLIHHQTNPGQRLMLPHVVSQGPLLVTVWQAREWCERQELCPNESEVLQVHI